MNQSHNKQVVLNAIAAHLQPRFSSFKNEDRRPDDPELDRQDVNMIWMPETALILKKNGKLQDSEDI